MRASELLTSVRFAVALILLAVIAACGISISIFISINSHQGHDEGPPLLVLHAELATVLNYASSYYSTHDSFKGFGEPASPLSDKTILLVPGGSSQPQDVSYSTGGTWIIVASYNGSGPRYAGGAECWVAIMVETALHYPVLGEHQPGTYFFTLRHNNGGASCDAGRIVMPS
jgi:hypothetical protein